MVLKYIIEMTPNEFIEKPENSPDSLLLTGE